MNALIWVDRFIGKSLTSLLIYTFFVVTLFLGGVLITGIEGIPGIFDVFFEYRESLWDLSNAELAYLVLLSLLIYRHISYCREFNVGIWATVVSPFFFLGCLLISLLVVIGALEVITIFQVSSNLKFELKDLLSGPNGIEQFYIAMSVGLSIYLATPTSKVESNSTQQVGQSDPNETEMGRTEQRQQDEESI